MDETTKASHISIEKTLYNGECRADVRIETNCGYLSPEDAAKIDATASEASEKIKKLLGW